MKNYPAQKNTGNVNTNLTTGRNETTEVVTKRRIQDGITSKNPTRKMNLDRRYLDNERRCNSDSDYECPSRRYTIDRRLNLKDRRKPD